jgi:hypothetical protein
MKRNCLVISLLIVFVCFSCDQKDVSLSDKFQTKTDLEDFLDSCETEKDLVKKIGNPDSHIRFNNQKKELFYEFPNSHAFGNADGISVKIDKENMITRWNYFY